MGSVEARCSEISGKLRALGSLVQKHERSAGMPDRCCNVREECSGEGGALFMLGMRMLDSDNG
jgi:hypothetical protein